MAEYLGCGDNSCYLEKPSGQATNGGCRCFKILPTKEKIRLTRFLQRQKRRINDLEAFACGVATTPLMQTTEAGNVINGYWHHAAKRLVDTETTRED